MWQRPNQREKAGDLWTTKRRMPWQICVEPFRRSIVEDWSAPHDDSCLSERVIATRIAESKQAKHRWPAFQSGAREPRAPQRNRRQREITDWPCRHRHIRDTSLRTLCNSLSYPCRKAPHIRDKAFRRAHKLRQPAPISAHVTRHKSDTCDDMLRTISRNRADPLCSM